MDVYLNQFNDTINVWVNCLNGYTMEMLCQRPGVGEWSLGQVYVHFIADTQFYIQQAKAALLTTDNSGRSMHENGRAIFDKNAFPDTKLANPFNSPDLRQPESKAVLLEDLAAIKNEVNELYNTIDFATSTGKTEHPGFKFFTAFEWLRFAEIHMRHHLRQKDRIDIELFSKNSVNTELLKF